MSDFPECLLIVTAEVDPAVEDEWNRWYDTVHLPDALKCPGVRRGRRYVSSGEISESIKREDGKELEADLHDGLRARPPGRDRHGRVPGHARVVPLRSARSVAHASYPPGRLRPYVRIQRLRGWRRAGLEA